MSLSSRIHYVMTSLYTASDIALEARPSPRAPQYQIFTALKLALDLGSYGLSVVLDS